MSDPDRILSPDMEAYINASQGFKTENQTEALEDEIQKGLREASVRRFPTIADVLKGRTASNGCINAVKSNS